YHVEEKSPGREYVFQVSINKYSRHSDKCSKHIFHVFDNKYRGRLNRDTGPNASWRIELNWRIEFKQCDHGVGCLQLGVRNGSKLVIVSIGFGVHLAVVEVFYDLMIS
ncbi:MAG: hypothetical protein Q9226_007351, partial [Calogaya cf. arnoldii]